MRLGSSIGWRTFGAAAGALALAACGGGSGGGGSGGGVGTASVKGVIVTRDGTTDDLAGVRITDPRTGTSAVSGPTGAFDLGLLPAGTITLRVSDGVFGVLPQSVGEPGDDDGGLATGSDDSGDDLDEDLNDDRGDDSDDDADDDGDDHDVGDDDMDVAGVADGEDVEVRLHVRDGVIESCEVSRSSDDDREIETKLALSAESDDADLEGEMRLESRIDRERIRVEVEHLTPGRVVEWFVIAPDATEESQGTRTADASGEAEWEPNTGDGDTLPFGVLALADLEGYGVEVRDATTGVVLLFGTIGAVPESTDDDGEDGSRGRALLTPAAGVPGEASVEVESETGDGHEQIEFEIEGQAPATTVEVWLEDPANLGTLTMVGSMTVGGEGEAELEFETEDGDTLPYGVLSVSALVGLNVEFRDAAGGAVLFSGVVPALVPED